MTEQDVYLLYHHCGLSSGDSCASLATRCDITTTEFYDYNPATDLCSTLVVGELICCTSGSLPDLAPSPYANGTCYTYLVESGDSCSDIAIDLQVFESGNLATSCIAGTGINSNLTDLCAYACQYDYCPTNACDCTETGETIAPPDATYPDGYAAAGLDSALYSDLCDFSCSRGYCPSAYCTWNPPTVTVAASIGIAVPTNIVT